VLFESKTLYTGLELDTGNVSQGCLAVATSATVTPALPKGYSNTSYLQIVIEVQGKTRVTLSAVGATGNKYLVHGTTSRPGILVLADMVNSVSFTNLETDSRQISYFFTTLPDITLDASFKEAV
jgi:hypothetical protein